MTKKEAYQNMKQRNDILSKMLKQTAHSKPKRSIDDIISLILKNLKMLDLEKVRRFVHNSSRGKSKRPDIDPYAYNNFNDSAPPVEERKNSTTKTGKGTKNNPLITSAGAMLGLLPGMEIPKSPYLPEKPLDELEYTLVLDLDETLIHFVEDPPNNFFRTRPGAIEFLEEMSNYYEIVIFTAGMKDYADWVLDQLDSNRLIKHRLYRSHVKIEGFSLIKDLESIGRNLKKTLIIDNLPENFKKQPDNGIFIKTWYDDMTDTCLYDLIPLLKRLVIEQVPDVGAALKKYRDQVIRLISAGVENPDTELIKVM